MAVKSAGRFPRTKEDWEIFEISANAIYFRQIATHQQCSRASVFIWLVIKSSNDAEGGQPRAAILGGCNFKQGNILQ
jgi:hypothetical protein